MFTTAVAATAGRRVNDQVCAGAEKRGQEIAYLLIGRRLGRRAPVRVFLQRDIIPKRKQKASENWILL